MDHITLKIGQSYNYKQNVVKLFNMVTPSQLVMVDSNGNPFIIGPEELEKYNTNHLSLTKVANNDIDMQEFYLKMNIIQPLLDGNVNISAYCRKNNYPRSNVNRYIANFKRYGVAGLMRKTRSDKGGFKIPDSSQNIIINAINTKFLSKDNHTKRKIIRESRMECFEANVHIPCESAVYARLRNLNDYKSYKVRNGNRSADLKFGEDKDALVGEYPLEMVQIDHCKLDIWLVDEQTGKAFKRPWFTAAIDTYSRVVTGFYLSFDPPGNFAAGRCIANSIITKNAYLSDLGLADYDWPCYGKMKILHMDNAKEFRGKTMQDNAAAEGIDLRFRRVRRAEDGAHIERLLGTFQGEMKDLPGAILKNLPEGSTYDPLKTASMTIDQLERWLVVWILGVYHIRKHSELKEAPIDRYNREVRNLVNSGKGGDLSLTRNPYELKLAWMPRQTRVLGSKGLQVFGLKYSSPTLSSLLKTCTGDQIIRIDPRDLSKVYFYDQLNNNYIEFHYANLGYPPISVWELDKAKELARETTGKSRIQEVQIFRAFRKLKQIEEEKIKGKQKSRQILLSESTNEATKNIQVAGTADEWNFDFSTIKPYDYDRL